MTTGIARSGRARKRGQRPPMTGQLHGLPLDRAPGAPPLYTQIRDGVRSAVLTGALAPGTRLPPERELATSLGVNRTTTMRAYHELAADGVVDARPGRGTIVRPSAGRVDNRADGHATRALSSAWLPGLRALGHELGPDPGLLRDIIALGARDDVISFAGGIPTGEAIPLDDVRAALTHVLAGAGVDGLTYGPVEGLGALRRAVAARLTRRGAPTAADEVMILTGATQGLALAAQALVEPGDEVVVEAPTYVGIAQTFGAAGARLIGVPVDAGGLRVDVLAQVLARRRVRLIVVQPTLHNPTGATMPQERRERLVALARRHGVPLLEDAPYAELWAGGSEPLPLTALDRDGLALHLGSFSKTVAPGLRVGWLAGPAPVVARLALAKQFADLTTGALSQRAVERLLASGAYDRHLARVRALYAARRAAMAVALRGAGSALEMSPDPCGGFYLWCRLRRGRARLLAAEASRAGVALLPGDAFYPAHTVGADDGGDRIRLSVAGVTPAAIAEGVRRLLPLLETLAALPLDGRDEGLRPVV